MSDKRTMVVGSASELVDPGNRRSFLRLMGMGGALVLLPSVFAACGDDDDDNGGTGPGNGAGAGTGATVTLDFNRADDVGVLNYAYALEQLEAAFYSAVVANAGFNTAFPSADERTILTDIRNHEVIHRDFLAAALANNKIGNLNVSSAFTGLNLNDRNQVLATARTFEDLGVAAYNGAGQYLKIAGNLLVAGKIVSVEARHASIIRDLIAPNTAGSTSFAPRAFDEATAPTSVATAAQPFIVQRIVVTAPAFTPSPAPNS